MCIRDSCGQKVNSSSKNTEKPLKTQMIQRIEKIINKDKDLKSVWKIINKNFEFKECRHSLTPVFKSKKLTSKGKIIKIKI